MRTEALPVKSLLSHFQVTPKSVSAFILAGVAMLASFHYLDQAQAEAIGGFVTLFLALLVPARGPGANQPAQEGQ